MTSSKSSTDGLALPALCAVAAVAIGYAVQLNNGAYGPEPLRYLTIGLGAALLAIALPRFGADRGAVVKALAIAMALASAFQIALIVGGPPGIYLRTAFWSDTEARFALALGAIAVGLAAVGGVALQRGVVLVLFTVHVALAIWTIKASPNPHIDVYTFHTEAFKALSLHKNPYAITMPNIYFSDALYGPGTTAAGRVLAGYLYPPLSLVMGWLAHLFGDYRYANVFSTGVAGIFMAYARPGRLATSAAALYWFSPRILFVIEQGWTEPQVVLFIAMTVFAACRAPRLLPIALGLLFSSKQYAFFVAPLAFMLLPKPTWKGYGTLVLKAAAVAAVITLPWALWNVRAFVESVVVFQSRQPFRQDALSYLVWSAVEGLPRIPLSACFVMLVPAFALALWRAPRTPAGFAASAAIVFLVFFAFAKQAFCNYYMMIVGALCCAAAAARVGAGPAHARS